MDECRFFRGIAMVIIGMAVLHKIRMHGGFRHGPWAGPEGPGPGMHRHGPWAQGVPPMFAEWHRRAHANETQSV